jgi:hypothetical protein
MSTEMFGLEDDLLIENLAKLGSRLCCYYIPNIEWESDEWTCDCKFGMEMKGESTGCPEVRQAIKLIRGQRDDVIVTRQLFEDTARRRLGEIKRIMDRPWPTEPDDGT